MPLTKKPIELGTLDLCVGFYLRVAQVQVFKIFDELLGDQSITPAAYSVMEVLHRNPGITQSKLAAAIYLDRSSVVPLLDKLEKRSLITRQASTTDRRHNHLHLTETGLTLVQEAARAVMEQERQAAKALTEAERETLLGLLRKFTSA